MYNVYVYNDLKQQKMPKRIKMLTSKWNRKQENTIHTSCKITSMHSVCRETIFYVANNGEGGGEEF